MSERIERIAAARVDAMRRRIAEATDAVPGVVAVTTADGVMLSGARLTRRWLTDDTLRGAIK